MVFTRKLVRDGCQAINRSKRAEIIPFNSGYCFWRLRTPFSYGKFPAAAFYSEYGYPFRLFIPIQDFPMKAQLVELLTLISSGCLGEDEIQQVADEASQAYADPAAFLAANPDINYDDDFPIPLGEWVVVGSLPEIVLFMGDSYEELFGEIRASFDPSVSFVLQAKQLRKAEPLAALNRIQTQLGALYPEKGGYVLVDFSEPLDTELQCVLVYRNDLERVLALCVDIGIPAVPALQAAQDADQA
jgi:hypothetical protein